MTSPPAKPKLLLVGHTYMIAVNREKANALAEFFEVCVCTIDSTQWMVLGSELRDTEADRRHQGYQLHRLARWPKIRKATSILMRGFGHIIRDFQPDIILVENEPWSLLRWQVRCCSWIYAPKAKFAEFTWENIRRPGIKGWLCNLTYRAAAATTNKVICGNVAAAQLFIDAGLPAPKILVDGQLGVSEADFPIASHSEKSSWRTQHGWASGDFVVGFCGRLVEEKGLIELANAIQNLRAHHPHLRLALLGDGPIHQELTNFDPSQDWLKILPPVPHLEVHAFLNKLDLFILPSKPIQQNGHCWEEQFGHVLIEAITAGVLTIGSDSGAIPEVLDDPQWIFSHSSQQAITDILHHILNQPEHLAAIQNTQREKCLAKWNHNALARRYASFLYDPSYLKHQPS